MKNLVKHVQNMNAIHKMWNDFDTLIIGVSGGSDSMCLLHLMIGIARKEGLSLVIAHVNYGLRGKDSDADQALVEEVARVHDLPCEVLVVDSVVHGEDQWRTIRYDFFEEIRQKYKARRIAVAHNQNDQAETFLLHFLRGSGLTGLVGMRFVSAHHVIRPILSVPRDDVRTYCVAHNVRFHEDKTNENVMYTRNRIRKELIPYLQERYNPQIVATIARTAEMIADDMRCINDTIPVFWTRKRHDVVEFSFQTFSLLKTAVQRRTLLRIISELCGNTKDIEKGMIDEMRKVILSTKGKTQFFTGKNLKMIKKNDTVELACHGRS